MRVDALLTIITVTKNCCETIQRTLDSVEKIKNKNNKIEYIVIDGVSTDGTLKKLYDCKSLIDLLVSEPDKGIYHAMNKGVALANGKFILFLNGDDELISNDFSSTLNVLEKNKNKDKIICSSTLVVNSKFPNGILIAKPWLLPFFNSIPHPSSFVPRELLTRYTFREDLRIASDYDFFLRCYLGGVKFQSYHYITALHQRGGASGNVDLSQNELNVVRKDRLGMMFPIINLMASGYRFCKKSIKKIV